MFLNRRWQQVSWGEFAGEAYGIASKDFAKKNEVDRLLKLLNGDKVLFILGVGYDVDFIGRNYTNKVTLKDILEELSCETLVELQSVKSWDDLTSLFLDCSNTDWGFVKALLPEKEYEQFLLEEKRKELEPFAADLASKYQVKALSLDFIQAIHEELSSLACDRDQWNNPEVRAEEWAAHQYVGSDAYFDDLNFENGRYQSRFEKLHDLLDWLGESCPLLMAQWNEQVMSTVDGSVE